MKATQCDRCTASAGGDKSGHGHGSPRSLVKSQPMIFDKQSRNWRKRNISLTNYLGERQRQVARQNGRKVTTLKAIPKRKNNGASARKMRQIRDGASVNGV
jgi:hypothetical protein